MKRLVLLATTGLLLAACAQPRSAPPAVGPFPVQPQPTAAVRDAQEHLAALGFYNGPIDGLSGPDTQAAVDRYQRSRGLAATGELNNATLTALRAEPRHEEPIQVSDATSVRTLQNRLAQLGYFSGPADGVWGPSTQVALENYQRARGLAVSGQVTPSTLTAMGFDPNTFPPRAGTVSAAEPLNPAVVQSTQRQLRRLGFYRGAVDGVWGPRSENALVRFQQSRGLQATGELNPATLAALGFDPNNLAASAGAPRYSGSSVPR